MQHKIEIKLKQLLKEFKMTQQDLSKLTGLPQSLISLLVNNKMKQIPILALNKISEAFELEDIRDLIDYKKE